EVVGYESPNRYNKIENVPLYSVEEALPDITYDGMSGITSETEFTAIVIPDTILPNVDDLIVFSYHENQDNDNFRIYRINNVNVSSLDSNTYYQISLMSTPYDKDILDGRQVTDNYNLVYNNIGTSDKTIMLQSEFIRARELEIIYEDLLNGYIHNYYDKQLGCFLFKNITRDNIYSSDVHQFLSDKPDLLINRKTFMKNIKLINYVDKRYNEYPSLLLYKYMEDIDRYGKLYYLYKCKMFKEIMFNVNPINNSTFKILPEKYIDLDGNMFKSEEEMIKVFNSLDIITSPLFQSSSFINISDEYTELLVN